MRHDGRAMDVEPCCPLGNLCARGSLLEKIIDLCERQPSLLLVDGSYTTRGFTTAVVSSETAATP